MATARELARRAAGEPLVAFLVLGLALFAVDRWWSGRQREIVVDAAEVARIADLWSAQMGRPATPGELDALIDQHVREEVLYRAAVDLGLDRDDVIVRRRLAQKMSFLLEGEAGLAEPGEDELRSHWRDHPERWTRPARIGFQHVYWSAEERGDAAAEAAARSALAGLAGRPAGDHRWRALGDPFMLQRELVDRPLPAVAEQFGADFARRLEGLAPGEWAGPVPSAYGSHLVRVLGARAAEQPAYEEVRDRVLEDLRSVRRAEASEAAYQELAARYRVEVRRE